MGTVMSVVVGYTVTEEEEKMKRMVVRSVGRG
jgi:hypothetical protein